MTLWGGRFAEGPDPVTWSYTVVDTDRRLLADDIRGSLAHVAMLADVGLVTDEEGAALTRGLEHLLAEAERGEFLFAETDEDVHSAVERRLVELEGEVGLKLHTGRSRNDQIALDMRLHLRGRVEAQRRAIAELVEILAGLADEHAGTVVPSYTHLQQAQAVPLGHHLLAYAWMLMRDRARLADVGRRLEVSPLGAGASGGSSLALDPGLVAERLGLVGVFENSLDAVGSRDLVTEYSYCCTQALVNLSRLAEEMVLWASAEFGWVTFSDRHTTGSSALPQKKNPDVAEHARGRSGDAIGALTALLVMQKGLPLAYNSDLQGDKAHVFRLDDLLEATLGALGAMLAEARFHPPAPSSWTTALDLAEALVGRGVPFRSAHEAVGRLVASLMAAGRSLAAVDLDDLTGAHESFAAEDLELTDPTVSVTRRRTPGGGSPVSVRAQLEELQRRLAD